MESQEGAGGTGKRRRETGKRKTTASKWKLWEEEESKKSVGSMLSREERKAMAVSFPLSLFLALSSPAPPFHSQNRPWRPRLLLGCMLVALWLPFGTLWLLLATVFAHGGSIVKF